MGNDYINALINSVSRVVAPNVQLLKDVLVIGGMPEETQNLKYLSYNRDTTVARGRSCEFSAVAVLNNRRADHLRLTGYQQKLSRWVFSDRWARNPLDLFLNNLRCDTSIMDVLAGTTERYSLLGILTVTELTGSQMTRPPGEYICPVVALPGIDGAALAAIEAFESANRIKKSGVIGFCLYRKTGGPLVV